MLPRTYASGWFFCPFLRHVRRPRLCEVDALASSAVSGQRLATSSLFPRPMSHTGVIFRTKPPRTASVPASQHCIVGRGTAVRHVLDVMRKFRPIQTLSDARGPVNKAWLKHDIDVTQTAEAHSVTHGCRSHNASTPGAYHPSFGSRTQL
ncbi:hypothetical protein BCR34DRAFT_313638 [Clohesyomyces aquaticus]|uniref:Uncharacterized protein n=1 Tax=Clohesyomyces aquaticus TaxID=1231657 RepID=A0A1Y1ZNV4_9PLEO|nr:hypothetical protein BCR34DRAFT_313638 [Clohesyomyces aquaticus]